MKTYIAHYAKLPQRKEDMLDHLYGEIEDFEFVENEHTERSSAFEKSFYEKELEDWELRKSNSSFRELTYGEISLTYKHYLIFAKIAKDTNAIALVLEDDARFFKPGFMKDAEERISETNDDWDLIFPGSGCGLHIPNDQLKEGKRSYLKSNPATRCTDSFFIKREAALSLIMNMVEEGFALPIDFEMNYMIEKLGLKVYWLEPSLIYQGSQTGDYERSV